MSVLTVAVNDYAAASSLGWLDLDGDASERVAALLRSLEEPGTIDALGLGSIRDAFSDMLTPGTSTVQTRLRYFISQTGEVDRHENHQQHDDRRVDRDHRPLPTVVCTMEPPDAHNVGDDRRQTHRNTDHGTDPGTEADQRKNERNQHIGEAAAHSGDQDRPRECAFSRAGVGGRLEAGRRSCIRHCLDGTRQGNR